MPRFKKRVFEIIEVARPKDKASNYFDVFINSLIFLNVLAIYAETFSSVSMKYRTGFIYAYVVINLIFTVEYILRLWTADLMYPKLSKVQSRVVFVKSFYGLVDLVALVPFWSPFALGINTGILRIFRMGRLLKIKRFSRLRESTLLFARVFNKKRTELEMTFALVITLILIAALFMYYAENPAQPDVFRNAYDSVWWAVVTLTTVGYGDMVPITPWGRFLGGMIALLGIGLIALPTGILSGALMDEFNKKDKKSSQNNCPHCGKKLSQKT